VFLLPSRAAIALGIALLVYGLRPTAAVPQESTTTRMTATRSPRPPTCKVTLPVDESFTPPAPFPNDPELWPLSWGLPPPPGSKRFWFGTQMLWTVIPTDGTWGGFEIGDPAFVYNNKLPWFALSEDEGQLTITGKKLDEPNLSFTEFFEINRFGRTKTGIEEVMGGISIPASGCWQVTGHFKDRELSFVVWVTPIVRQERPPEDPRPAWTVGLALAADPVPVDGEVEAKRIVYRLTPEIPPRAKLSNVSGTVVLHAIVGGNDGVPRELQYVSGPPLLVKSAMDAVKLWRYRADGRTDIDTTIEVVFPSSE
jgi:hypothetical protein